MPDPANVPAPVPDSTSGLKTPSSLVLGAPGTGKTDCLLSYITAGIDVFVLVTEPDGVWTLVESAQRRTRACAGKIDYLAHLHYHLVRPATTDMKMLIEMAESTMKRDPGELQKMSSGLCKKDKFPQYIQMLKSIADFHCDRTRESFGDVTTWDDTRAFCIDSLSGITFAVARHVCGLRGILTQPEYQVGQQLIMNLIMPMCGLNCFFAMTAHEEWERDELQQKQTKMVATLGSKIAPQVPIPFSDVIKAYRNEAGFWWNTDSTDTTTKWRALPRGTKLPPDFSPVVSAYRQRKQLILEANQKKDTSA
jgi:hypothetical protein